ncbi:MAG: ABC transporter substrate-binding protein [Anaerolineaceae bacterium]|nr:ABC transporter substrate-binding protein [Anaerolineaceae bacterium]
MSKKLLSLIAVLLIAVFVLSACAPAAPKPAAPEVPAEPAAPAAPAEPAAPAAPSDKPYAGKTVTIFGVAADEQARLFQKEFDVFTERTGIIVTYEGNKDFETLVVVRVEGGDAPDIAQFAQPGLVADFVRKGKVIDLNTFMADQIKGNFSQGLVDLASVDGKMAGIWHNADVKSLVWYPKQVFDAKGYKIPQTWDELLALSDQIVADGGVPWCIGIESAGATGWVGTDWVEDIMLRTTSPENYDKWTRGELKFDSPEVRNAFEMTAKIWLNPKYVYGGVPSILTTGFGDSPKALFDNPPKCMLHRQASFITNFFPETAVLGENIDYFYLPPIDPAYGKPVLGSGSLSVMFNDRPEVREVMKFLATGESVKIEVEAGVAVAPHLDADPNWYPNNTARGFGTIIQEATTFRFDGSDLMPGAVGAGSFWKGIVDWVNGTPLDIVLKTIDDSWPK